MTTENQMGDAVSTARYSLYLPVLLLVVTMLFWLSFQCWQLVQQSHTIEQAYANQEQLVINASKMRKSLDAIASATQKLADQGNPNARLLVDELKRRGVSINPNPPGNAAVTP